MNNNYLSIHQSFCSTDQSIQQSIHTSSSFDWYVLVSYLKRYIRRSGQETWKGKKGEQKEKNEYALIVTTKTLCKAVIFWLVFLFVLTRFWGFFLLWPFTNKMVAFDIHLWQMSVTDVCRNPSAYLLDQHCWQRFCQPTRRVDTNSSKGLVEKELQLHKTVISQHDPTRPTLCLSSVRVKGQRSHGGDRVIAHTSTTEEATSLWP